ncbi:hypothetical protein F4803DRAFT_574797 [Xylaria telfairii]|nr:hypothetical protein F4803DRAFT_574797 [Xylaria telfairii]
MASCIGGLLSGLNGTPWFPYCPQEAMAALLSGVYDGDFHGILPALPSTQSTFLRLELQYVDIKYGHKRTRFLCRIPAYRLDINPRSIAAAGNGGPGWARGFWRMVHIDCEAVAHGARKYWADGKNLRQYGTREGILEDEGSDCHPHFIPGVFIAMAQRYRAKDWDGQQAEEEHGHIDQHVAPTWQILFTNGTKDNMYAHLYTTQVPGFIQDSFETPARLHAPIASASTQSNATIGRELVHGRFEFRISHTKILYMPSENFRQRLRYAIVIDRDRFGETVRDV